MKRLKTAFLPASAVLLATSALAQSSLTLSGRVDLGLLHAPTDLAKGTDSSNQVAESSNGRLNLSGREDLGSGLSAFFMMEARFNADTGAITDQAAFFKDKSWVGLASKDWGEVKMGRLHSPQYGIGTAGRYEAFIGDSYASMGTRGARSANQWNNSVYYTTPTVGGFHAGVIKRFGEGVSANGVGGHLVYADGPLSLAYSYQKEQDTTIPTIFSAIKTHTLGGFYDFGVVKFVGTYARSSGVNTAHTGSEVVWTAGARVPLGPGEFRTSYRVMDDTNRKATGDASGDQDSRRFSVGYAWYLSKLTSINLSLVRERQKRYSASGATTVDNAGNGAEAALRVMF
ncbi:hypothetical protein RD110_11860 [Rhodoferax koreense]|uniref:Porin domain-containing protein n=1 Tax=Rhodoferax koreensis TaxID=1842727 RepID=A0A1P8JVN2_9BURK|nr:porin [Rhodoferax koreense]APW37807.1 hypothetical protein RD110_11860 [Rhodoferax koreense]